MAVWDPVTYLQFADERSRPFFDLVRQVEGGCARPRWSTWDAGRAS